MRHLLLFSGLLLGSCSLHASQTVKVELVAIPAAKSIAAQSAKRAVTERPIITHAMEAELGADGRVRTRCAPGLPDLRRWPEQPGPEQPE